MWIKTPQGKLINLEKVSAVQIFASSDKGAGTVLLNAEGIQVALQFDKVKTAQEYFDKLAEKFGAEAIDIDQT